MHTARKNGKIIEICKCKAPEEQKKVEKKFNQKKISILPTKNHKINIKFKLEIHN